MCGISGILRFNDKVAPDAILRMNNAIRHRGPDDEGYVSVDANGITSYSAPDTVRELRDSYTNIAIATPSAAWMGFRRLSIIDLSYHGHQPMLSPDGSIALTFNGEIYNYKELRQELQSLGYHFNSETDTEVILTGYRHWGKLVVERLNGMFAFAIYDLSKQSVFIARDRLGIKPLFYHTSDGGILWASEIKAIVKSGLMTAKVNWQGVFANYQLQTTPSPYTCFEDIFSLPPAHWMEINVVNGLRNHHQYWQIPVGQVVTKMSRAEAVAFLDSKLQAAVTQQLRSDVPVTSLMSGGIDSTTLTAICTKQYRDFHCYSLGFDGTGKGADELPQAIAMAQLLGIKQHVHHIQAGDVIDTLDADLRHFEEPYNSLEPAVASSAYLHREGYKVVMNGLGADEVFGGYAHYLDYKTWQSRRKLSFLRSLIPAVNDYTRKAKNYLGLDTAFKYFINSRLGMRPFEIKELTDRAFTPADELLNGNHISNTVPEELFYYDLKYYIGAHHVYRDDLSSMRYSLEVRYPYLDHELIEWVATLPMDMRYDGVRTKPLLRSVAERYITKENMSMPKKGFNLPLDEWMKESQAIQDYARTKLDTLEKRQIFNKAIIEKWWRQRNEGACFAKIWQLVTTEVWLSEYIDGR